MFLLFSVVFSVPADSTVVTVYAKLSRTPAEVHSMQAAFIFAEVQGTFQSINLSVEITVSLYHDGWQVDSREVSANLPMLPVPHSPGWYVTAIPWASG